jgi:uncharacterized protein YabE (DUF348 family)
VRRSFKYGLYGAVLAGVIGGTVAWIGVDKTVTLEVDGQVTHVHTVGATVQDVLASKGYTLDVHDLVAPPAYDEVHGGSRIVLQRGRLLDLSVDGVSRQLWVTAPTVDQALADLGYETADFASVSRAERLPLSPTSIEIRTPKQVTLIQGGQPTVVTTTAPTVGDLLHDLDVTVGPSDTLSPDPSTAITAGMQIQLHVVTNGQVTAMTPIPFTVKQIIDPAMPKGTTQVITPGKNGVAQVSYAVVYVDGVQAGQTIIGSVVVTPPTTEVQKVGSKVLTRAPPVTIVVNPGSAQAIAQQMLTARGWGSDQFACLLAMWGNESGWRVNAHNSGSGAYGIPQALPGSKMAAFGSDWQTNPATQIAWGLSYISGRYGTPCGAWSYWQGHGWY